MKNLLLLSMLFISFFSWGDATLEVETFTAKMKCKFSFDDASGKYDGKVSAKIKAAAFSKEDAKAKVQEQCEELKQEFIDEHNPDAIF